jgi:hypothetical protein
MDIFMHRCVGGLLLVLVGLYAGPAVADPPRLDLCDVSWLLPAPQSLADLDAAISIVDINSTAGTAVWSDDQFADLLAVVDNKAVAVGDTHVEFPQEFRSKATWRVAAFRFDPSAPGCGQAIREAFGSVAQLRVILQPVTVNDRTIKVHDVTVHLVFSFVTGTDDKHRFLPDLAATQDMVQGLDELKVLSQSAGATTSGKPLNVHPGLANKVPGLRSKVIDFLSKHLDAKRMSAIALMGIRAPEPWIFIALSNQEDPVHFKPAPGLPPEMIAFGNDVLVVSPPPKNSNLNPIANQPIDLKLKRGVATASLFASPTPDLKAPAVTAMTDTGEPLTDQTMRNGDIADYVANPTNCHFFNTDCISCHTETRRRIRLDMPITESAFVKDGAPPRVADEVLPKDDWNIRNFGWFPPSIFIGGGPTVATATQRTANETADVVEFIERNFRKQP